MSKNEAGGHKEEVLKHSALNIVYGEDLQNALGEERFETFRWDNLTFAVCMGYGTKKYENIGLKEDRVWEEDTGIELPVFSQNIRLILFKKTRYLCNVYEEMGPEAIEKIKKKGAIDHWQVDAYNQYKERTEKEGPQSLIYYLDNFSDNSRNLQNNLISHIFIAHMVEGVNKGSFPIEKGDTSLEFIAHLIRGFKEIRTYINSLNPEQINTLNDQIKSLSTLSEDELNEFAKKYITYGIRTVKSPGTLDDWTFWRKQQMPRPNEAVEIGTEHLGCSFRNLPEAKNSPFPWKEFTTNRWDANHQIYGRYESKEEGGTITLDYKLDSSYFPGKYHFFNKLEIIHKSGDKREQIIFGQAVNKDREAMAETEVWRDPNAAEELFHRADFIYPLVLAGDLDFNNEDTRRRLTLLAENKNTKPDVAVVLRDILEMAKIGVLMKTKN